MPKGAEEQQLAVDEVMDPLTGEVYGDAMAESEGEPESPPERPQKESGDDDLMDTEIGGKSYKVPPKVHNALKAAQGAQGDHDRLVGRVESLNQMVADLQKKLAGSEVSRQERERADAHLVDPKMVRDAVQRAEKALDTKGEFEDALRVHGDYAVQQAETVMVDRYFNKFLDILERHEKIINSLGETTAPIQQLTKIDGFLEKMGLELDANEVYAAAREHAAGGLDWDSAMTKAALELDRAGRKEGGGSKPRQTNTATEDEESAPATRPTPGGTGRRPGTHSVLTGGGESAESAYRTTNRNTLARQRLAGMFK